MGYTKKLKSEKYKGKTITFDSMRMRGRQFLVFAYYKGKGIGYGATKSMAFEKAKKTIDKIKSK